MRDKLSMNTVWAQALLVVMLASCATSKRAVQQLSFAQNPVVAHRGAFKAKNLPENSLASLNEAIRLQCTGSEFDVRMTMDDSLIINHDPHYRGKEIEKTTYSELVKVPLSNGETLPTLRQYLNEGMKNNVHTRLVLEVKPSGVSKERGKLIAERSVKMVHELNAASYIVYISFDYDILKKIIQINPVAQTQFLNGDVAPAQLKADGITGADYHFSVFKAHPEWIEQAQKHNIILNAWTVNDKEEMQRLLASKFQFITTNEPELLLSLWKSMSTVRR
ncbi:MAG TPA: glycerophosphodiester phosphodiesterase family protein [Chitinophagaceae bacterium]|jgi:glycerophosphoryl diester phosphodiesterase|nr:glycerophosphodiester phosphodiesterase family protein [Chitinophagaceae bacterium]